MEDKRAFEEEVRYVYGVLLDPKQEGLLVTQNARIRGKSRAFHHFDVYYEFERDGVRRRVAIECNDPKQPVDKGTIGEFANKLGDIGNTVGVVISRAGYLPGVDAFARQSGIDLLRPEDLPSLGALLAKRAVPVAEAAAPIAPDEASRAEPFWTIMELNEGKAVGYYATEQPGTRRGRIPLLYARKHAERIMREGKLDPRKWGVRGLSRPSLHAFIGMLGQFETQGGAAMLLFLPPAAREDADFIAMDISRQQLIDQYASA